MLTSDWLSLVMLTSDWLIIQGPPAAGAGPAGPVPGPRGLGREPRPQCRHLPLRPQAAAELRQGAQAPPGLHLGQGGHEG